MNLKYRRNALVTGVERALLRAAMQPARERPLLILPSPRNRGITFRPTGTFPCKAQFLS
jgi:hypothetical protein